MPSSGSAQGMAALYTLTSASSPVWDQSMGQHPLRCIQDCSSGWRKQRKDVGFFSFTGTMKSKAESVCNRLEKTGLCCRKLAYSFSSIHLERHILKKAPSFFSRFLTRCQTRLITMKATPRHTCSFIERSRRLGESSISFNNYIFYCLNRWWRANVSLLPAFL